MHISTLLSHLAGVSNTRKWEACQNQLKHHAEKMDLIRGKYRHRIQMVAKVYIYLRDKQAKNLTSIKSSTQRSTHSVPR